jgi:hypothetical protein
VCTHKQPKNIYTETASADDDGGREVSVERRVEVVQGTCVRVAIRAGDRRPDVAPSKTMVTNHLTIQCYQLRAGIM